MDHVIEVGHLRKSYGETVAVADVSFSVARGEIFGLLGRNGAGKTTSVECVQGLRRPDGGDLRVLDLDPQRQTQELRRRIGCQLQDSALPDRMRVWEALDLFSSLVPGKRDWRRLLEEWGLGDKAKASFGSLSGGQRQRLLVALALVNDPEIVFLDEMTTGLDPAGRRVAWELVRTIRDRGATVVLVTHFMDEAEELCDRVAVVDQGRVVAVDSPQGLIAGRGGVVRLRFSAPDGDLAWLGDVAHVQSVVRRGSQIEVRGDGPVVVLVAAALVEHGIVPADLRVNQPTLEDVFLAMTGGAGPGEVGAQSGEVGAGSGATGEEGPPGAVAGG